MAASPILGLWAHNFSSNNKKIIAVWKGASMVKSSTAGSPWVRGATLTSGYYAYMASFINRVFLVNGQDSNWEYNGSYWTVYENTEKSPIANFIIAKNSRLYLLGIKINNGAPSVLSWPSRVWFSDLPNNNTVTWGLEYGYDLVTTSGSAVVTSATAKFITRNIKIGDPFFINYSDVGNSRNKPFTVQSIDSETQITLTEDIPHTSTDDIYWVGSNWFDVGTDDGDLINGVGKASNEILIFKNDSVYRYNDAAQELRLIKDIPGTTNPHSIVSWGGYCYWIHPSGIYRSSGGDGERISNAISDIFGEISPFVGGVLVEGASWVNKIDNTINFSFLSTNLPTGETFTNFIVSFDTDSNTFSFRDYPIATLVATQWNVSAESRIYVGDDSSAVYQIDVGTTFDGDDIPCELELYPIYPAGEGAIVNFDRLRTYVKNGPDIQIFYKLIYKPRPGTEDVWDSDDTWYALQGSQIGERVDWVFPTDSRASGVKLKFVESGGDESFLIEKFDLYYSHPSNT